MFAVKEIFYTLQGEGAQVGRAAVFCRFAGCNLWSGLEKDRADAICDFCDTDFVGGERFADSKALVDEIDGAWPGDCRLQIADCKLEAQAPTNLQSAICNLQFPKFVVCTGGEPLLQMNEDFVRALHERGFEVAIETNGTKLPPPGIDWICVSPKANADLVLKSGNELKLIFPQAGAEPERYEKLAFEHFFLQPMDGPERRAQHATRGALLPGASALALEFANAKISWHQMSVFARGQCATAGRNDHASSSCRSC